MNDTARARGTLPGVGEETQEIDNLLTLDHEVVHTYGHYLRRFVADIRARDATPIVCSLVPRKVWHDGRIARNERSYAQWARETAAAEHVGFIDLNEIIARRYEDLGPEEVEAFFADKDTHTTAEGARINATAVVAGLKALQDCGLCGFLSPAGDAIPAAPRD